MNNFIKAKNLTGEEVIINRDQIVDITTRMTGQLAVRMTNNETQSFDQSAASQILEQLEIKDI